jgi:hypothetical protein
MTYATAPMLPIAYTLSKIFVGSITDRQLDPRAAPPTRNGVAPTRIDAGFRSRDLLRSPVNQVWPSSAALAAERSIDRLQGAEKSNDDHTAHYVTSITTVRSQVTILNTRKLS